MNRLDTICSLVKPNSTIYDIGCDHGYLLLKLYPKIKQGFALDIAQKPLNTAIKTINEHNISDKITAILSNGLEKVDFNIADTIVIAGMGGELIVDILSKNQEVYNNKYNFIFQSMSKTHILRKFLYENGFEIIDEKISIEEKRFYTIINANFTGNNPEQENSNYYFSDKLKLDTNFNDYLDFKIEKLQNICNKINDITNTNYIYYSKIIKQMEDLK